MSSRLSQLRWIRDTTYKLTGSGHLIPMDGTIKQIIRVVVIIAVVIWLLQTFGYWGRLGCTML